MKKILTIFIPTFNRSNILDETIFRFIQEITSNNLERFVDFLVGDNASSDNTVLVAKKYGVNVYSNEENLGITRNILRGLSLISSEFVWIFGDDDVVAPKFLESVINELLSDRSDNLDALYLPSQAMKDRKKVNEYSQQLRRKAYIYLDFQLRQDVKKNVMLLGSDAGFISSHIFRLTTIMRAIKKYDSDSKLLNNNYYNKLLTYDIYYNGDVKKVDSVVVLQDISSGSYFSNDFPSVLKTYFEDIYGLYPYLIKINTNLFQSIKKMNCRRRLLCLLVKINKLHNSNVLLIKELFFHRDIFVFFVLLTPRVVSAFLYFKYKEKRKTNMPNFISVGTAKK